MAIGTYAELQTSVASWMARSDLTARVPDFITLCEAKLNRDLMVRQMEQRSTTNADTTSDEPEFITLPDDFQAMRRVCLSGVQGKPILQYLAPTQINQFDTEFVVDTTGQPIYFTIINNEMQLLPTPDDNYEIEMVYRKYIPALSDDNTTNWLLTLAPDLYLYGALREASVYMQNDDRVPLWTSGYKDAIDKLSELSMSASFNAGPIAVRVSGPTP